MGKRDDVDKAADRAERAATALERLAGALGHGEGSDFRDNARQIRSRLAHDW